MNCSTKRYEVQFKPVIQEEKSGCGIATVAVLAGVAYQEVKKAANGIGIRAEDRALWSDTAYVRRLLAHYGIKACEGEKPFSSWNTLPDLALLAIKWRCVAERPFWHWTLFVRDCQGKPAVLDPKKSLRSNVRRDFGRMRPKWFIPVVR